MSHNNIGALLLDTGKPAEDWSHQAALAIRQKLAGAEPANTVDQQFLAMSHNNIAVVLKQTGKPEWH